MALTSYREVRPWARAILAAVQKRTMPPWHAAGASGKFLHDARLSEAEVQAIAAWVRGGAVEGNAALAALPEVEKGWRIGKPDLVLSIPETVLEGEGASRRYVLDPGLSEDVWVEAIEVKPGNRRVVHHAQLSGLNLVHVPGDAPEVWPAGMAKRVRAGEKLELEIHYGSAGGEQKDRTEVGLRFAREPVGRPVRQLVFEQRDFEIPAQAADVELSVEVVLEEEVDVLSLNAEMQLRGKAARFEVVGGEVLLEIPAYEYDWQRKYVLARPVRLGKGSRLRFTARYDNSANHRLNPDPGKTVGPGEETMRGIVEYVVVR